MKEVGTNGRKEYPDFGTNTADLPRFVKIFFLCPDINNNGLRWFDATRGLRRSRYLPDWQSPDHLNTIRGWKSNRLLITKNVQQTNPFVVLPHGRELLLIPVVCPQLLVAHRAATSSNCGNTLKPFSPSSVPKGLNGREETLVW